MSSNPAQLILPSGPSNDENLLGAILWLPSVDCVPDYWKYKLKAKACDHPCLVVQDCRATDDDTVRICILASYSQETSYKSLGRSEKFIHFPIHPNKPNQRTVPNVLYLRPRQKTEMFLRKSSWVNARRIYKVPISILRPYENHRKWCRFRLAETSIRALNSALFPASTDADEPLLSPIRSDNASTSEEQLAFPSESLDTCETVPAQDQIPQEVPLTQPDCSAPDGTGSMLDMPQLQLPVLSTAGCSNADGTSFTNADMQEEVPRRIPLSDKPSPFHLIYPFDSGPHGRTLHEQSNSSNMLNSALPLFRVLLNLVRDIQTSQLKKRSGCYLAAPSVGLSVVVMVLLILTLTLALALNAVECVAVVSTMPIESMAT